MVNKHRRAKKKKINEVFEHHWGECFERHYPLTFLDDNAMTEEEINDFYISMMSEKEKLNATKSLLNNIDIHIWRSHTTQTHKCGLIVSYLKNYIKAEFVTQAWAKFYTILGTFDLFSENLTVANSVHLCEAPGAFISSLNHYLQSKFYNIKFNWIGTTLNPYYEGNIHGEMIVDDRFLIETLPNWNFGKDFSGNIMCASNMEFLIKSVGSIDIVTADGSIDCSDDPAEQEIVVAPLLLWETVTALNILSIKGNFVLKIFTTFENFTICLLYFLCKCFESVTLSKPGPSKSGNSEVYVVCKNYQKDLQSLSFQKFYQAAIQNNLLLVTKDFYLIPKSFIKCIKSYVFESCRLQVENILFNLDLFKNPNIDYNCEVNEIRHYIAQRFLDQFKIHKIENFISPLYVMTTNYKGKQSNFKPNLKKGSFDDRSISAHCLNKDEKALSLDLRSENDAFLFKWSWHKSQNQNVNYLIETETLIIGKAFLFISYSCFCNPLLLSHYYKLKIVFHNDFLKDGLKKLFSDFKFSSNFHFKIFSEIDIDLGAILPECCDVQCNRESDNLLYICYAVLKNKKESIVNILKMMQSMKSNCCCIFILNDLLLSNFWNGIFFIITQCFEEVAYVHPNMCTSFLVFRNLKSFDNISHALTYLEKVNIQLSNLTSGLDVLHVVPIYYLMKSTYREYVMQENEAFIRKCL